MKRDVNGEILESIGIGEEAKRGNEVSKQDPEEKKMRMTNSGVRL